MLHYLISVLWTIQEIILVIATVSKFQSNAFIWI